MKRLSPLLAVVLAASLIGSPSLAGEGSRTQARDAEGDSGSRLDLVLVRMQGRGNGRAVLTIRTANGWGCAYLTNETLGGWADGNSAFLWWEFDRNGDDYFERVGHFRCRYGEWIMEMSRAGEVFSAQRPDRRTIKVTIPLGDLGLDVGALQLQAQSQVSGAADGQVFLEESDSAPVLRP